MSAVIFVLNILPFDALMVLVWQPEKLCCNIPKFFLENFGRIGLSCCNVSKVDGETETRNIGSSGKITYLFTNLITYKLNYLITY